MTGGQLFSKLISRKFLPFTERGINKLIWFNVITFPQVYISILNHLIFIEVAKIMFQISSAVQHLHSMKIAHRGNRFESNQLNHIMLNKAL